MPILPFLNNPKDLDLSCKMDPDLLDCFGRKKLCLITEEIGISVGSHIFIFLFTDIHKLIFSSPSGMFRKSCCTTLGIIGGIGGSICVNKMLKFYVFLCVLCDGQGAVRRAVLRTGLVGCS